MSASGSTFFTIGHSNRSVDELVALLRAANVTLLVDVRTIPRSRPNPRELCEGVRLQYELETQYRRKDKILFRSTRTFQRLAGARRISKRFLQSQSTLRRARQPKMPCARLNRSLGGWLD